MIKNGEAVLLDDILDRALFEDLGTIGDITSKGIFNDKKLASGIIKTKERCVVSGIQILKPLYQKIDPAVKICLKACDGDLLDPGSEICLLDGAILPIMAGERIALNFLQRLCGIATKTSFFVNAIRGTGVRLLDTRKTTPTFRFLEKKAVLDGGGFNHRRGLFDMILIKDTHVKAAGGVVAAINMAKQFRRNRKDIKIEVEVGSIDEFFGAFECKPDRIMLDNMSCEEMARCVIHARKKKAAIELEASGNVNEDTVREIAETGVDFISVGSLTHSVKSIDIHLIIA